MPFFKDLKQLRRRSTASYNTDKSSSDSNSGTIPPTKSSSTLGSSTPPSAFPSASSSSNLQSYLGQGPPLPARPQPNSVPPTNRYSITSLSSPSINGSSKPSSLASPYAPRVLSVTDNSWVHQKILLIYGHTGDPAQQPLDGNLTVYHHQDSFPPTNWPVCESQFKALVYLSPGPNRIRLDVASPKLPSNSSSNPAHSSCININYLPLTSSPPLQLAILVAKDSPLTFDAVPERIQREGNGLETAIRKFRMAAYLWQAFTGEQMYRNRFGRRCFRYEEEWQPGTLTCQDQGTSQMRNEARVHVIRTNQTVNELRDLEVAQQYDKASRKGDLFAVAMDAVRGYFRPLPHQKQYVSVLILDTHWDKQLGVVRGHAALGGGAEGVQLAIFGSHALQSYPSCIEETVPAFSDCTRTDTTHVANDCNESGSNWEAANIGIGAHLHETGHLFGCPHQEYGIMLRDYVRFNRTFTCREPYSTRTKSPGLRVCLPKDECGWHRLDCLRFRCHPCFRLPTDGLLNPDESVQTWAMDNGTMMVTAATGVAFIEIFTEEELCHAHIEYFDANGSNGPPKQVTLTEADLRSRLPDDRKPRRLKLAIHTAGQGQHTIDDFGQLTSKQSILRLPNGQPAYRSNKLGLSQMEGSRPDEVILQSAIIQTKLLVQVKVFHGFAVDGLEFVYEDSTSQLFGKRGGKEGGSKFDLGTLTGRHGISTEQQR
ncbi:MAG: hypothetical protein M1817_006753 [Caeruleum heppii]|nr:MAG: hypothetical protein M1817_006753 [Caeruleum heppii]